MLLINFAHPITPEQRQQVEALSGQAIAQIIDVDSQIDSQAPLWPQAQRLVEQAGLTTEAWQTRPLLVNLPSLNYIAAALLAELHGRCGYFPAFVRLRPVEGSLPPRYELAEIINLQAIRDAARQQR
jgi:hypothetical protein